MKRLPDIWILLILGVYAFLTTGSALSESLTFDEPVGHNYTIGADAYRGKLTFDPYNPPFLMMLNVLPEKTGITMRSSLPVYRMYPERMMTIIFGAVLIYLVYRTGCSYISQTGGRIAALVLAFDPTFLAHSHYITFDTGTALLVFLAISAFIRLLKNNHPADYLQTSVFYGLAMGSRIVSLVYLAAATLLISVLNIHEIKRLLLRKRLILIGIILTLLTVWGVFLFQPGYVIMPGGHGVRFSDRVADFAQNQHLPVIAQCVDFLKTHKVPLGSYLNLLKNNLLRSRASTGWFFLGKMYTQYHWYFLPVIYLIKTPIPEIIFLLLGIIFVLRSKSSVRIWFYPFLAIFGVAVFAKMNPQVRYILPVYPFAALLAAVGFVSLNRQSGRIIRTILLFWLVTGTLLIYPSFITYANAFAGSADNRYRVLTDSNLDWGQGLFTLQDYVRNHEPAELSLSYFGQDDAGLYGFANGQPYDDWRQDKICRFHHISYPGYSGNNITIISVSNWYTCGYNQTDKYTSGKVKNVIGNVFLEFDNEK